LVVCVYPKKFFKEPKEVQQVVIKAAQDLYKRIAFYEKQNVDFQRIFNDEKVKYDKHGEFYTFKFRGNNLQVRVLYTYFIADEEPTILVADFFVKKKNNKEYIKQFESLKNACPFDMKQKSKTVYSC